MSENSINPALAEMDVAQDEMATYAMLVKRAQSSLIASSQAFERANETSTTGNCPIRKQITQKLRQQYAAIANLTDAIVGTLDAPTFSRMIATAPRRSPLLLALVELLPEEEKELIIVSLRDLLQGENEKIFLTEKQVELTLSILYAIGKEYVPTSYCMDNDYDQFAAQMLLAGWSLDKIEAAWQRHLRKQENLSEYSVVYHDADPSYLPPIEDRD